MKTNKCKVFRWGKIVESPGNVFVEINNKDISGITIKVEQKNPWFFLLKTRNSGWSLKIEANEYKPKKEGITINNWSDLPAHSGETYLKRN